MENKEIILLSIGVLLICAGFVYLNYSYDHEIDFGGVKISSSNLKALNDALPDSKYTLCEIDSGKCTLAVKKSFGENK